MGLTRARAWQIFDIDYKQAVRAITLTNITLSGSAPSTVDGVHLVQDDRVLVAGQSTAAQNGIYVVTVLGTGSTGTWVRAIDGNETGEIQAGMIVMVTEGDTYKDSQWKLVTDDPITVGVTSLTFEQNGTTLAGNFLPTANASYTLGNATQQWKSLYVSGNTIYIGDSTITSNATGVSLTSPGGAIFTVTGTSAANTIGNFGIVSATGNVQAGNLRTAGLVSATGTITGANITGSNFLTGGLISSTGTITGGNLQTNGTISATGNITGGNILGGANVNATTHTGTTVSVSGSITGGNLFTGGEISATGRIQGANITGANLLTGGMVSSTGTITGGNLATSGTISATGAVSGLELTSTNSSGNEGGQINLALAATNTTLIGNVVIDVYGDKLRFFEGGGTNRGAYIDLAGANAGVGTNILSGGGGGTPGGSNTYVQFNDISTFGGNAQFTYNKVTDTLSAGIIASTNNGNGTNFKVGDDIYLGDINTADTLSLRGIQNAANAWIVFGNANGAALGRAGTGPLTYGGAFSASGNVTGDNILTSGLISATGNITGGNIRGVNIDSTSADVAERYLADADYPVGTVLVIGGAQELTQSTGYAQTTVVGTVSEQPALTMNRDLQGEHVVSLAFLGRVPCRVVGNIDRGDMLVSSNTTGVATSMESYVPGAVLGKALESYNSDTPGVIEIIVGRL